MIQEQASPGVREVEVDLESEGQRIDNFLISLLKGVPRTHVYRILRRGEVRVNKGRVKPDYRLEAGDRVRLPPVRVAERSPVSPNQRTLDAVERSILYEDSSFLILDKPAGIAVHGGSGVSYGVIEALRALRPTAPYLELGHRLDRETSGCLVLAKRASALRAFQEELREGRVDKKYLALVKGEWRGGARRVEAPLLKNQLSSGERMVRVDRQGKPSVSLFEPLARGAVASLVRVTLLTGRTHQVRVHSAHVGHPLAGDDKYGDKEFNLSMRNLGLKRLFLHSNFVGFKPRGEQAKAIGVTAPLPDELNVLVERLGLSRG